MNKNAIKIIISCAIVVIIGIGGYYGYCKQSDVKASSLNKYLVATAKKSDLQVTVQTTGTVYASTTKDTVSSSSSDNIQFQNTTLKVKVSIDAFDISKVQVGQKAEIKFDALRGKAYDGNVDSISQVGTSTNGLTTYYAIISIKNSDGIKAGMNANVNILVSDKQDVLTVPIEALIERNDEDYVLVSDPNTATQNSSDGENNGILVQVQVGLENDHMVEIISGLNVGDNVLVTFPQFSSSPSKNSMSGGFGRSIGVSQKIMGGSGKSGQ